MKKLIYLLMAFLWLSASTGFSITKHYCGGKYVSMSINSTPESCCETGNCCHNESEAFQLDEDTVVQADISVEEAPSFDVMVFENEFFQLDSSDGINSLYLDRVHIPPPNLPELLASFQSFLL